MIPSPTTLVLWRADMDLGRVPGPLYIASDAETSWIAAGGRGESAVFSFSVGAGGAAEWTRARGIDAHGLRSVVSLGDGHVLVSGEHGYLARSEDAGRSFSELARFTRGCLYGLSRDGAGNVWLGSDDGLFVSRDGARTFKSCEAPAGRAFRVVTKGSDAGNDGGGWLVTEHAVAAIAADGVFSVCLDRPDCTLNDVAVAPSGLLLVAGNAGKAWLSADGRTFEQIDVGTTAHLERAAWMGDTFAVLDGEGGLHVSRDGRAWTSSPLFAGLAGSCIARHRDGWLVGAWRQEGPPYRFVGALAFLGPPEQAPRTNHRPRAPLPFAPSPDEQARAVGSDAKKPSTDRLLALVAERKKWPHDLTADAVRALISAGADVHAVDAHRWSVLQISARGAYAKDEPLLPLDVLDVLLEAGADPNVVTRGETALTLACSTQKRPDQDAHALRVMRRLVAAGARVPSGHVLSAFAPTEQISLLIEAGASLAVRERQGGGSLLHAAARVGAVGAVRLFLSPGELAGAGAGVDVDVVDDLGRTALGVALQELPQPWVAHNGRTQDFEAIIAALREAGCRERLPIVPRPDDAFAPRPFDGAAARAASLEVDAPRMIETLVAQDLHSFQELAAKLPHYGEGEVAVRFVRALAKALPPPSPEKVELEGPHALGSPFFWHGDLVVKGHLEVNTQVVVTGNLTVEGVLRDSGNDSLVTIGGTLRCESLYTDGDFAAQIVEARDVVYGYYNDFVLAADVIRAKVVIEDDHCVACEHIESPNHIDLASRQSRERVRALFCDEVFDEEGGLDRGVLFSRLERGEPVFR